MPFKLCNCDKVKLNRVIDQVKALSKTVDELREEIDSLKTCFAESSSDDETLVNCESFEKGDNFGPLRRLKKCLEKNVIPIISRDTGYRVKKKCQQFFSQSPRTVPCPAQFSFQESSPRQCCAPSLANKRNQRKHASCQTPESTVKQTCKPSIRKTSNSTRKCMKNVCEVPKKCATVSTPSSTDSLRSSGEPSYCGTKRKKITAVATSTPRPKKCTSGKEEIYGKYSAHCSRKSQNFKSVDKAKCVATVTEDSDSDSSTSSCILTSKTSIDHLPMRKTNYKQIKKQSNDQAQLRNKTNTEKLSLPQCSPDCRYVKGKKLYPKDMSTNTINENSATNEISKNSFQKKQLESQETQTYLKPNKIEDINFDAYRNASKWLHEQSSISLTSCSPTIIYFPLKTNHFEKEISPRADQETTAFEPKRPSDLIGNRILPEKTNIVSTNWNEENQTEMSNELRSDEEFSNNRLKRTYVISPGTISTKTHEKVNQDSNEHQDLSSVTACPKLDEKITQPNCKCGSKEELSRRTICTNRPKLDYLLKFPFWSRKKSRRTPPQSDEVICSAKRSNDSPSSPELSDGSCSLTSNCNYGLNPMSLRRR